MKRQPIDTLAYMLMAALRPFALVDGRLFFPAPFQTPDELAQEIARHASPAAAQNRMNLVLFERFIDEACGNDWDVTSAAVQSILETIAQAWSNQIRADYPGVAFSIEQVIDEQYGDVGLWLQQPEA